MAPKKNWKIINCDDFVIFKASDDIVESANASYARSNEINRKYIESHETHCSAVSDHRNIHLRPAAQLPRLSHGACDSGRLGEKV